MSDFNDYLFRKLLGGLATKWVRNHIDLDGDGIRSKVKFHEIELERKEQGQVEISLNIQILTGEENLERLMKRFGIDD